MRFLDECACGEEAGSLERGERVSAEFEAAGEAESPVGGQAAETERMEHLVGTDLIVSEAEIIGDGSFDDFERAEEEGVCAEAGEIPVADVESVDARGSAGLGAKAEEHIGEEGCGFAFVCGEGGFLSGLKDDVGHSDWLAGG